MKTLRLGRHMRAILEFAERHNLTDGRWHSFHYQDHATARAVRALVRAGILITYQFHMFTAPDMARVRAALES